MAGAGSALVLKRYVDKSQGSTKANINVGVLGALALATAIQLAAQCAIYFVEVHAVDHSVSVGQILTYTGAANFALFVALTPGAIGIRESFLLFTQHLHHLGSAIIVSANVIDRAAYLVLLGILFVIVSSMHAGKKLRLRQFAREAKND